LKVNKGIPQHKLLKDTEGYRVCFYCDISGALMHTTEGVYSGTAEEALDLAWKTEGENYFNRCHKCGKYVSDMMYNADVLECVACAPWENLPNYCSWCGHKLTKPEIVCPECGHKLRYEGGGINAGQI